MIWIIRQGAGCQLCMRSCALESCRAGSGYMSDTLIAIISMGSIGMLILALSFIILMQRPDRSMSRDSNIGSFFRSL